MPLNGLIGFQLDILAPICTKSQATARLKLRSRHWIMRRVAITLHAKDLVDARPPELFGFFQKWRDQIHRQREYDGGVLVRADHREGFQIA